LHFEHANPTGTSHCAEGIDSERIHRGVFQLREQSLPRKNLLTQIVSGPPIISQYQPQKVDRMSQDSR